MNNINLDEILERGKIKEEILSFLDYFYRLGQFDHIK